MSDKSAGPKTILVIGASSGFGRACAELLAENGHEVYGTSRNPAQTKEHKDFTLLTLDVRDDVSVASAVETIIARSARLDVVINSAGICYAGAIEDMSMDEYRHQLDTNFFGIVRVIKSVLPHMRQKGAGLIINISSIGGFVGLPFQSAYSASKFALEGFTESLRHEARPFGIKALLLQPGDFKTNITNNRLFSQGHRTSSVYFQACKDAIDTTIAGEVSGKPPEVLARKVVKLIENSDPAVRYTCGPALQRLAAKLKYWIPASVFENMIAKEYKR